jgi:MFS superfamily sulfate permease-like transporter
VAAVSRQQPGGDVVHADALQSAFAIVFLGGALQVRSGVARLGRYVANTPIAVYVLRPGL